MKRQRNVDLKRLGPATAAMRRAHVFRDARQADTQITAEKLIQDAVSMHQFYSPGGGSKSTARLTIYSKEELAMYRQKTRSELEERVKRGYAFIGNWIKYARWEAQQRDFVRMRAVLERAIPVHGDNPNFWRDYAELESSNGFVQQAREVYDRAVSILPLSTDLWLKYLIFEQVAGQDAHARDAFSRWVSGESPPDCAFELFTLFEAQRGYREACEDVLRRYVGARNGPRAWMFFGQVEQYVFRDGPQAIKTLQMALEALPDEYLWGPMDCRVPLLFAEILVEEARIAEARSMYQTLLRNLRCEDPQADTPARFAELVLSAYSSFERLHGDRKNCEALFRISAKQLYERRLKSTPEDFDARLSLYLLLREEEAEMDCEEPTHLDSLSASSSSSRAVVALTSSLSSLSGKKKAKENAMQCLLEALHTTTAHPHRAQQRAVLVMEYARRAEAEGQVESARQALSKEISEFPFEEASCTRLWLEAADFEQRQGEFDSARRLLQDAARVCSDPGIFTHALRLEQHALEKGAVANHAEYLSRARGIYQNALRMFPTHEELWFGFAKMEEREGQFAKSHVLYQACAQMLTAEAAKTKSYTERYALLSKVNKVWAHRIAMQTRLIKRLAKASLTPTGELSHTTPEEVRGVEEKLRKSRADLHQIYRELLDSVWADYVQEALAWKGKYEEEQLGNRAAPVHGTGAWTEVGALRESERGSPVPPPLSLPDILRPASARWSDAVAAVKNFIGCEDVRGTSQAIFTKDNSSDRLSAEASQRNTNLLFMRDLFKSMIAKQRDTLRCTLGFTKLTGFDASERIHKWVEFLLSPLLDEWSAFEVLEGGSLTAVKESISVSVKRRRRLFIK